jgi:hypothetical protein
MLNKSQGARRRRKRCLGLGLSLGRSLGRRCLLRFSCGRSHGITCLASRWRRRSLSLGARNRHMDVLDRMGEEVLVFHLHSIAVYRVSSN